MPTGTASHSSPRVSFRFMIQLLSMVGTMAAAHLPSSIATIAWRAPSVASSYVLFVVSVASASGCVELSSVASVVL